MEKQEKSAQFKSGNFNPVLLHCSIPKVNPLGSLVGGFKSICKTLPKLAQ